MNEDATLQTAKILTANKLPDRFLDTKIYEPTAPEESIYGNTYILVEVTTPWFPTAKITKLIRNTFLEEYYHGSFNRAEVKRFEDGLKAVNKKLSDLAGAGQIEWIGNLNAIISTISDNRLYLSHTGTAEAYLFRKNKISHITEGEDVPKNPTPIQTFSALINGDLEREDRLVLSNSEMYNFVSIDTLRNAVDQISPNSAVDEVANILYREKADKVNAIFIYLSGDNSIDAKAATALPDTIFLDNPEAAGSIFKKGLKPKNILATSKSGITSIGSAVLGIIDFFASLFKRKKKEEIEPKKEKLKNEPIQDLSYMTSSIDLNLSHGRDRTRKTTASGIFSIFGIAFNWLRGLNKKWLYGGIAFIIILLVVGGIYFKMSSQTKNSNDLSTIVSAAQEKINSADTQAALHNDLGARNLLLEARTMLEDIKDKPKSPVEVIILLEKIQEKLDKVNKVIHIDNPKELANLSSIASNIDAKNLIYLNGALYAINIKGTELIATIVDKGDKQILTKIPSDAGEAQTLTSYDNDRILVVETSKARVFEFSLKTNKLEEKKNAQEIAFPDANAISTYLSTLYFLNKDEGTMLKFAHSGAGYDKGRNIYKEGVVNIKDINSFAIDGNIYLLFDNGIIEKTLKGSIDSNFKVKNIPEPNSSLESPNQMVTSADLTSLYVLENKKHRVIELNKNGDYLRQFTFKDNIGDINSFSVNEKAKKLYLLASNKIFEIDL
ncbi:MAG: hypothetical protein NT039_04585 [Candidatus Berkelbacteria bacterium]|nr:hypothetical protein [Candidatus Berkelbacteria bacterium]